jgi:siroheme synthase-like protein
MDEEAGRAAEVRGSDESGYYPVFLDVAGRRCVVVGGGEVAVRKVGALLDHGARVAVISPELCEGLRLLADEGRVEAVRRSFKRGDLNDAFLAVAATSDEGTNEEVADEARSLGLLVNVADVPGLSTFIVPSCLRRGNVIIAVSTGGKSPALAKRIRRELESVVGEEYGDLCALVETVRSEMKGRNVAAEAWQRALDLDTLGRLLREGRGDEARSWLKDRLLECGE